MPAVFDKRYFEKLEKFNGDEGAKRLIDGQKNNVLILSSPKAFVDIDTMEDYTKLLSLDDR